MRNHTALRRLGAVAVASAVVGLSGLMSAGTAAAAAAPPAGTLTVFDLSVGTGPIAGGSDVTSISLRSGPCDVKGSDSYNAVVSGPGAFAPSPPARPDGLIVVQTQAQGFSTTDVITTTLRDSMKGFAVELGTTIVPGDYVLTLRCIDGISATVFQTYSATLTFSSPTAFTVKGGAAATPAPTASGAATPTPAPAASGAATPTPVPSTSASATATPAPSTSATASPDPSTSLTPTVDPISGGGSSTGGTGTGSTGTLAYTGAPVDSVVLGGLALVVLGAALRHAGRRRGLRG